MKKIKDIKKYSSISFPDEFIAEIKKHIEGRKEYRGVADFARQAIGAQMQADFFNKRDDMYTGFGANFNSEKAFTYLSVKMSEEMESMKKEIKKLRKK